MQSVLELSSPSMEERLEKGTTTTHLSNDEGSGDNSTTAGDERLELREDESIQGRQHIQEHAYYEANITHMNQTGFLTNKEQRWIQKQKQTINEEHAARDTMQNQQPMLLDDDGPEGPQSYYGCTDIPLPDPQRVDDAAAISVMIYLLVIAFLLAVAVLIGTVVVSKYGFIVLVAAVVAIGAMLLVFLVVMSVIQGDRKLTKARSQIYKWSMEVKEVIMKEVADLQEDLADYSSGMLLLTYEGDFDTTTSDYVRDNFDNKGKSKQRRRPKSIFFRLAVSPLKKLTRKSGSGKQRTWFGKKKKATENQEPAVPPTSEHFEVV